MASGKITTHTAISGSITPTKSVSAATSGGSGSGGVKDHSKLSNRDLAEQHPISAITNLQETLNTKLDAAQTSVLIEAAMKNKAKGLYFDVNKELATKAYWYLTSEIDPDTKQGTKASIISGPYDLGAGGGGGGGGVTDIKLTNLDPDTGELMWPTAISSDADTCNITTYWSSTKDGIPTGAGTMQIFVNDVSFVKRAVTQGKVTFNIKEALVVGDNKIEVKVTDTYSTTKNLIGNITCITLKLESNFDASTKEFGSAIQYEYRPIGDIKKLVHFIVDGTEIGTQEVSSSGDLQYYTIPKQSHGAHSLKVYFTADIGGEVESNKLFYDLICYEAGNRTPIIASTFDASIEQEQYIAFNIPYRVYTPGRNASTVKFIVNGEQILSQSVDKLEHLWNYQPLIVGMHTLKIQTGSVEKEFKVNVTKSKVDVEPVTRALALYLNAIGRSNTPDPEHPEEREWWRDADHNINCKLNGFNFSSNGWLTDDDGNAMLTFSGDARTTIPYSPFAGNLFDTGKTIELEFKTNDVKDYTYKLIRCLDGAETIEDSIIFAGEDTRTKKFRITNIDITKFKTKVQGEHGTYIFIYSTTKNSWTLNDNVVDIESENNEFGITLEKYEIPTVLPEGDYFMDNDKIRIIFDDTGKGLYVTPQLAKMQSRQSAASTQYKEDDHIRLAFVINSTSYEGGKMKLISMYINGILSGVSQYPVGDSFEQTNYIEIGATENKDASGKVTSITSSNATLNIYNIRIYDTYLSAKEVVNNWIADTQNSILKAERYNNNKIYDADGNISYDLISKKNTPYMVLIAEKLPESKEEDAPTDVVFTYPLDSSRNYKSYDAEISVQGASSQAYYKKNFKIKHDNGFYNEEWGDDPDTGVYGYRKKYKIVPPLAKKEKKFTYKADVASSEGANNVELVRYFEDTKNWWSPAQVAQDEDDTLDGYLTRDRIRVGINGFPMIMFHKVSETAKTEFYGKMNFNNDKGNDDTYGFKDGDECWEFLQNNTQQVLFQSDDLSSYDPSTGAIKWQTSFESRFPGDVKEGSTEHPYGTLPEERTKLQEVLTWVVSTYRKKDDSEAEKTRKLNKFKSEFESYFDKTSALFYYLYTELFLMVDSRAKNLMLTYMKKRTYKDPETGRQVVSDGDKWYWFPYDMDTALGINNEGSLVFDYSAEDTDTLNGNNVFNGQDSVFWTNLRDAFKDELKTMYIELRNTATGYRKESWSFDKAEAYFETHQAAWSEAVFNEDARVKYLEPLLKEGNAVYLAMAQGSKVEQRRWWMYNRFKYLDSKYLSGDARTDRITFRAYIPAGEPKPDFHIIPYADIYVAAKFANSEAMIVSERGHKGEETVLHNPFDQAIAVTDQETDIFSASQLKDIGDISGFKPGYADFSKATKLQKLVIGNATSGWTNENLTGLVVGNNHLLTYLDARNCHALGTDSKSGSATTKTIALENCTSLEEVYFDGTQILGVTFPIGGNLKKVHLPSTITSLKICNHPNLTELYLAGTNKLESVWLEDIPSSVISAKDVILSDSIRQVRLINIKESFANATDLKTFYDKMYHEEVDPITGQVIIKCLQGINSAGATDDIRLCVTGEVTVPDISWSLWNELSLRFPEIKIKADIIRCVVRFLDSTGEVVSTQTLIQGESAIAPGRLLVQPSDWETKSDWDWEDGSIYDENEHKFIESPHQHYNNYYSLNLETKCYERVAIGTEFITKTFYSLPNKLTTNAVYYNFVNWDTDFTKVMTDLTINPVYDTLDRHFIVTSNTATLIITAIPRKEDVIYNGYAHRSELIGIPPLVTLDKWLKIDGSEFIYVDGAVGSRSAEQITNNLTITAKWKDSGTPTLNLTRTAFNKFKYKAVDNIGIAAYAVTNSASTPTSWINLESPVTPFEGEYTINAKNTYYFWVKDSNGNITSEHIIAYEISKLVTPGFNSIKVCEDSAELSTFALNGTNVFIISELDFHYKDAQLFVNAKQYEAGTKIVVDQNINITATCTTRQYTAKFDVLGKGSKPSDQIKDYLAKVDFPGEQYYKGFIIEGWYLTYDKTKPVEDQFVNKWNFETSIIDSTVITTAAQTEFTLYAKWVEYSTPTIITVVVPETSPTSEYADKTVTCWFVQENKKDVEILWGDEPEEAPTPTTTDVTKIATSLTHVYENAGIYYIKLTDRGKGTSKYGNSYRYQVINPSSYITDIVFSWDVSTTQPGAFKGSNITKLTCTPYMSRIESYAFESCLNLTEIDLSTGITHIGDQAFAACYSLGGRLNLPKALTTLGNYIFQSTAIEEVDFTPCTKLTKIGISDFMYCNNLKKVVFSEGITQIGQDAFENCFSLEEAILPKSLQILGTRNGTILTGYVFAGCTSLKHVVIQSKLTQIGAINFGNCNMLTTAGPIGGDYAIEFAWDTEIPDSAFQGANGVSLSLQTVILPNTITRIGRSAFQYSGLKTISLPPYLTSIGVQAFARNSSLSKITIPSTVNHIGFGAFSYTGLHDIAINTSYIEGDRTVEGEAFSDKPWFWQCPKGSPATIIHVPSCITTIAEAQAAYGYYWNYRNDSEVFGFEGDL